MRRRQRRLQGGGRQAGGNWGSDSALFPRTPCRHLFPLSLSLSISILSIIYLSIHQFDILITVFAAYLRFRLVNASVCSGQHRIPCGSCLERTQPCGFLVYAGLPCLVDLTFPRCPTAAMRRARLVTPCLPVLITAPRVNLLPDWVWVWFH